MTPVLHARLTRDHLSVISGITPAGQLLLQMPERSLRAPDVVRFFQHLLRHIPGPLLVIWDGAPIHGRKSSRISWPKAVPPAFGWNSCPPTPRS